LCGVGETWLLGSTRYKLIERFARDCTRLMASVSPVSGSTRTLKMPSDVEKWNHESMVETATL